MNAQGSSLIDTSYIDSLVKQIDAIDACDELKKLTNAAMASIQAQLNAVEAQMALIKPIAELLENPAAAIPEIIQWIEKLINNVLKPMYQPYLTMAKQVEATMEAIAEIPVAVERAAERIGECVVSVPAIVVDGAESVASGSDTTGAPE